MAARRSSDEAMKIRDAAATRAQPRPSASIRLAAVVIAVHLGTWIPLFLFAVRFGYDVPGLVAIELLRAAWFALPLLCGYGMLLGWRALLAGHRTTGMVGLTVNALYLVFDAALWVGAAPGGYI